MQIKELLELLRQRRSIRRLKPDPIPDEYIEQMLEAARWAMSGANGQPWEFIVVKNQETKDKIVELFEGVQDLKWAIEKTRVEELRHHAWSKPPEGRPGFKDAPVFIVVCGDPRTFQATVMCAHFLRVDGGAEAPYLMNMANATQNLHLAARALGLGSQWVSVNTAWEGSLKALLNVPQEFIIHAIVPVGYPAYDPPPPYRRELKEMVHSEKYDWSKYRNGEGIYQFLLHLRQQTKKQYAPYRIKKKPG